MRVRVTLSMTASLAIDVIVEPLCGGSMTAAAVGAVVEEDDDEVDPRAGGCGSSPATPVARKRKSRTPAWPVRNVVPGPR